MKISIVPIGNSKGVRIPKAVLEQCHMNNYVTMEVHGGEILLKPFQSKPRQHWAAAFKRMHKNQDDVLTIDATLDISVGEWSW